MTGPGQPKDRAARPSTEGTAAHGGTLTVDALEELWAAARRFTPEAASETLRLLSSIASRGIEDPAILVQYHDRLLFLAAYPPTADVRETAEREMSRVATVAGSLAERGERLRRALEETGVAWSHIRVALSYPVARWLADAHPDHADVAFFGEDGEPLQSVAALASSELEESTFADDAPSGDWLEQMASRSGTSRLRWLIEQMARIRCSEPVRELLFLALRAYVRIEPRDGPLSRTFARGLAGEPFLHDELIRAPDLAATLARPLAQPRRLTARDRTHLIDTGRAVLAIQGRETEPISLCEPEGVEYFDLGRGVAIALYHLPPDRRPLDPHVGLMLFKNSMPVAYGGGWPFLELCRIGIHVFEPYRGGESAQLFAEVLRVYHQRFGARRFVAEPSQFGAIDPDGLRSRAFWFYHRFGFRPIDQRLRELAEREWARMEADRGYRSPLPVLRRLAHSDMELVLSGGDGPKARCDPADLSLAVSNWIGRRFGGDRLAAERVAEAEVSAALGVTDLTTWPEAERRAFRSLSLLLGQVIGLDRWPARDRHAMVAAMRAKGSPRLVEYFDRTRRHPRFATAMAEVAAASDRTEPA